MQIQTPDWVKQAVFYQIFPDRFARSSRTPHPRGIQFKPWGTPPVQQGYQGGDLYGVVEKLDYLQDLGITALYLNPIFSAASNHRYNAYDYLEVDPLLGGKPALRELLDDAHRRGMKVVLDGVFNHCGRGFWAFHHILENGGNSPYIDWFTIHGYPLRAYPYTSKKQEPNYSCWWGNESLPKFNTNNPGVRDYLFQVTRYWLEFGADGWRLDVPEEIKDDSFWREFRMIVKEVNPEAYIVGEIWHEARHWLQGDMFDAVMNYQITTPLLSFFGANNLNRSWEHADVKLAPVMADGFVEKIQAMYALYDWEINYAQMNMLDSHDMPRALWLLNHDKNALKQTFLCLMALPGAPCVYYGDEIGLAAGTDPHCREAFPWQAERQWDHDLHGYYKAAIGLRKAYPALQTGSLEFVAHAGQAVVFRRKLADQEILAAFNASRESVRLFIPAGSLNAHLFESIWPAAENVFYSSSPAGLELALPGQGSVVLLGIPAPG